MHFVLWLLAVGIARAQDFTDAATLMDAVAKRYATDAETFHFESITETVQNEELKRSWQKSFHTVFKAPGNRFRIEVRSSTDTWVQASDGATDWTYVREGKVYVKRPAAAGPQFPKVFGIESFEAKNTWEMRTFLNADAEQAKNATLLPEETIVVEGQSYPCYVVHAAGEARGLHSDQTYWIEKKTLIFRKKFEHQESFLMISPVVSVPMHQEITTLYPVADLHPQIDPQLFAFNPPPDAKEVTSLKPQMPGVTPPPQLAGKLAPDISLTGPDGKEVKLSSFRGQPLLIDLWATWCGPCLVWMPSLGRLEKEMRGKLRVISVDRDEVPENATHYLEVHGFTWANYHDGENKLGEALGEKRMPLTLLIDAENRIAYAGADSNEPALRKAIAALASQDAKASR